MAFSEPVYLDLSRRSMLNWKKGEKAEIYHLDFGLQSDLAHPLSNQTQFLTLSLAVDHFCKTMTKEDVLGICLYRGSLDFSEKFPFDEMLRVDLKEVEAKGGSAPFFCRNVLLDYLDLLTKKIDDEIPRLLILDASSIADPLLGLRLLLHKRCGYWETIVLSCKWAPSREASVALCFPSFDKIPFTCTASLRPALDFLITKNIPFKALAEELVIYEWDGVDFLIVSNEFMTPEYFRKLQGFVAAGGCIVSIGGTLGLGKELAFESWCKLQ